MNVKAVKINLFLKITHRAAWVLCGLVLLLLLAGALVTSTDSGMAVPDWPLSFGQFFPPMRGGVLYEHGHRLMAALVGLMTFCLAGWLWVERCFVVSRRMAILGTGLVGLVLVQGILGGVTVLLKLPLAVSVSHALTAQLFFIGCVMAVEWSRPVMRLREQELGKNAWQSGKSPNKRIISLRRWSGVLLVLVWIEILLGAIVRHKGVGLIIPDFPLAYGKLLPSQVWQSWSVAVHYGHRMGALVLTILAVWVAWQVLKPTELKAWNEKDLQRVVLAILVTVLLQLCLGASIIWLRRPVVLTSLHLVNGALLNAAVFILWERIRCT